MPINIIRKIFYFDIFSRELIVITPGWWWWCSPVINEITRHYLACTNVSYIGHISSIGNNIINYTRLYTYRLSTLVYSV